MDDFAGSADQIAKQLVAGGMDPQQAMMMALRMAQSRQQADQSILGGVPTQPPTSDVPPATEILGGDPSRLFQRQPTTMERIKDLPKDVLGAGEALVSMGSLAALAPASMLYALRPGQKTQGDPMEFALRNMYMPRSERGPSHLAGLGEVLESLPQTGPLPELQAFTGVGRGVGRQLAEKGRQAGRAMAPAAANVAEDILRRQGLLMDVVKPKGGNWLTGDVESRVGRMKMADQMTPEYYANQQRLLEEAKAKGDDRAVRVITEELEVSRRNDAINNWIDRNLTNYIKKEMATPEDPVRKLAEQGITHKSDLDAYRRTAGASIARKREAAGFPAEGLGQSELGRVWENLADYAFMSKPAKEVSTERYPWVAKLDPETPVYGGLKQDIDRDLAFDHIVDVLRQDVREGRIRPEQLSKVSMEQAVRRTYEYDQEMAKKMREAQIKATEGMPVYKEYPEQGFKWIELAPPVYTEKTLPAGFRLNQWEYKGKPVWSVIDEKGITQHEAANSAEEALKRFSKRSENEKPLEAALKYEGETMGHCVGGYCPDVMEGRSQIFSLRDEKGEPHVTIEVQPVKMSQSEAASQARGEGLKGFEFAERVMNLMEGKDVPPNIVQIKGKQNRKPKDEYLPFVQDFVRSGNWSKVGDPQNAGLRRYTDVFNDAEQRKIEALNLPVPNHMWLTGEEIQALHNAINPEGKRLKYNASGQIVGDSYKQGGSVNHKAVASARRALEKAMAKGGIAKAVGKAAAKAGSEAAERIAKNLQEAADKGQVVATPAEIDRALAASAKRIGKDNPKLSPDEVEKKAARDVETRLKWERIERPSVVKEFGQLVDEPYTAPKARRLQNVPAEVEARAAAAEEFLRQPTEPWQPPRPGLQAFDRSLIKESLEGFPGLNRHDSRGISQREQI